ncbi:MAG TPA: TIGR01458 family HAD-type hydrolase [Kineosporiaceae bacterium]
MATVKAVLIDIDGVLTVSWRALPGAVDAMVRLRRSGMGLRLVTNTTSRTRSWMATRLSAQGFPVHPEDILTAPGLTARYLQETYPGARCLVLNSGDLSNDLSGITLVGPDAPEVDVVVLGGAGPEFSYQTMNRVFTHLMRGAALVAMNRNHYWATDHGLMLDTGTFLAGLEQASGRRATMTGKPAATFFTSAMAHLDAEPASTLMIGDDVDSDVVAAQEVGITGVLVRTGKYLPKDQERASLRPAHVVDSFADLPTLVEKLNA